MARSTAWSLGRECLAPSAVMANPPGYLEKWVISKYSPPVEYGIKTVSNYFCRSGGHKSLIIHQKRQKVKLTISVNLASGAPVGDDISDGRFERYFWLPAGVGSKLFVAAIYVGRVGRPHAGGVLFDGYGYARF